MSYKKAFYALLVVNLLLVPAYFIKRYYYSHSAAASAPLSTAAWSEMRFNIQCSLPIDSTDIIFVGNSLTDYWPVSEVFGKHVKNRGIGSNTTNQVLRRISFISMWKPRKIFIEIGINDLWNHYPIDSVIVNYRKIIGTIRQYSPNTAIYIQSLLPVCMGAAYLTDSIIRTNSRLSRLAKDSNVTYIRLFNKFANRYNQLDSNLTPDGVHLQSYGYNIWRDAVKPYVEDSVNNLSTD